MKSMRLPFGSLLMLYLLFVGLLSWTTPLLPDRMASHFGPGGVADGWMARARYVRSLWGYGTVLLIAPYVLLAIRWIPPQWIDLSDREPLERQKEKLNHILYYLAWMACLLLSCLGGAHYLTLMANRKTPPDLSGPELGVWVAVLLLGLVLLMVKMLLPFLKKTSSE